MLPDRFKCKTCHTMYDSKISAQACEESHEIIMLKITRTELNRLVNALFLEKPELIPESLYNKLRKAQQRSVTNGT